SLGIAVKVVTGDNAAVAAKVCHDLGLPEGAAVTGAQIDALDDPRSSRSGPAARALTGAAPASPGGPLQHWGRPSEALEQLAQCCTGQ
ncbi:MAG: P-type Mg2+ transporter, partial [Frankiales bacterium]|nr:P-type Mg2+ transporter [Frankiales bacterium]